MLDVVCLLTEHLGISENSFRKCPCIPASNLNLEMLGFEPGRYSQNYWVGCAARFPIPLPISDLTKNSEPYFGLEPLNQNLV